MPRTTPANEPGPHTAFIQSALPDWYRFASARQRQAYITSARAEVRASAAANAILAKVQAPLTFCKPLLQAALSQRFGRDFDVERLELVRLVRETLYPLPITRVQAPMRQSLLEAALQNFEADEAGTGLRESVVLPASVALIIKTEPLPSGADQSPTAVKTHYSYPRDAASDLKPAQFAEVVRGLDLGKAYLDHIKDIVQPLAAGYEPRDPAQSTVFATLLANQRARLEAVAHVAMMKGHLSASGYTAMLQASGPQHGTLSWDGHALRSSRLLMMRNYLREGTELHGPLVFTQSSGGSRCIVYLPADPDHPLVEYASLADFVLRLRERLRDAGYRHAFSRYVSRAEVAGFLVRLENVLSPKPAGQFRVPRADPNADLELVTLPLAGRPARILYERLLALMLQDAQTLVVPTNSEDRKSREARVLKWVQREMLVLNLAAFFIPAVGAVMAVVGAAQLLKEIADGVDDWRHGQTDEALGHVFAVGENLLNLAVIGAGAAAIGSSGFINGLVRVEGPLGERLWNAQLEVYRQPRGLPVQSVADEMGQYHVGHRTYIQIEGHFYEQRWDPQLGKWRLRHPSNPQAYEPVLEHNGTGLWRSASEDPAQWSSERLLKRLGYGAERFSAAELQRIRLCSDMTDAQLRGLDPARAPVPALLRDSIRRFAAARDLRALTGNLAADSALAQAWMPPMLVRLPRWPRDLALTIDAGGSEVEYGGLPGKDGKRISVRSADVNAGKLLQRVLEYLEPAERQGLLGDAVGYRLDDQVQALETQLREAATRDGDYWFEALYQASARPLGAGPGKVQADFPGLAPELAQEVFDCASTLDAERLLATRKLPLKMAEHARLLLREQRLNRALQGLYLNVAVPLDSDVLLLKMAERLKGWNGQVRVELRQYSTTGKLLASIGPEGATTLRYLMRDEHGYQAFDATGNALNAASASAAALLRALPDEARMQLGFEIYQGDQLHAALLAKAISSRTEAAEAIGQVPVPGWLRPMARTARGQVGYQLSGRPWFRNAVDQRLEALYPHQQREGLRALKTALGRDAELALTRLETEYRVLGRTLDSWVDAHAGASYVDGQNEVRPVVRQRRQVVAQRVLEAWRRETNQQIVTPGRASGYQLDLRGFRVGELPLLTARLEHVNCLLLDDMALSGDISDFLRAFPQVELLSLQRNPLTHLPAALAELERLSDLRVNRVQLQASAQMLQPLRGLDFLARLQLIDACAALPEAALAPLAALPRLSHLGICDVTAGLGEGQVRAILRFPALHTLALSRNGIVMTSELGRDLAGMTRLQNLQLTDNPLGSLPDLGALVGLERLSAANAELREWPPGLLTLMNRETGRLRSVELQGNPIAAVPDLHSVRFFQRLQQYHTTHHFSISRYDLSVASIERLENVGVMPLMGAHTRDLSVNMPASTYERFRQLSELPEAAMFVQAWGRIVETRDYELDPLGVRRRAWRLIDALCAPVEGTDGLPSQALREQVFALGDEEMTTCADGMALILSRWETLVLVEKILYLPAAGRLRELLRVSRRLFAVAMVDARAVAICGRRIARRIALNAAEDGQQFRLSTDAQVLAAAPPLDELDAIRDEELAEPVDPVEVRLKLRLMLRDQLELPLQPANRMYGANVPQAVALAVLAVVRGDMNFEQMSGWLVDEPYWRRYLRQQHPQAFIANDEYWAQGFEYLFELSREAPDAEDIARVPAGIIAKLRERYPLKAWTDAAGAPQAVKLSLAEQDDLEQWLHTARVEGERQPYRLLTEPLVRYLYPHYDD